MRHVTHNLGLGHEARKAHRRSLAQHRLCLARQILTRVAIGVALLLAMVVLVASHEAPLRLAGAGDCSPADTICGALAYGR